MGEYITADRDNAPAGGVFTPLNLQTYHYAGNNPIKYSDPSGRASDVGDGGAIRSEEKQEEDPKPAEPQPTTTDKQKDSQYYKEQSATSQAMVIGLGAAAAAAAIEAPPIAIAFGIAAGIEEIRAFYYDLKASQLSEEEKKQKESEYLDRIAELENRIQELEENQEDLQNQLNELRALVIGENKENEE